ncbi:MAG TPA: hypothetical protein VER58_03545 [Thermoanaerobaculia bacterium]|nr:hypothetical protein [Thermoanaerobaculia bacterium]
MRYLAIARFRLLTTIRTATPVFVIAILPPLIGAIAESTSEPQFGAGAQSPQRLHAVIALLTWLFHAAFLLAASEASGNLRTFGPDQTALPGDLMDSAPIRPSARFWGEAGGILAATAIIHACCLPLLAMVAALSPLPTRLFLWIEAGIIALMILGSTGAAWRRLAPRTKFSGTRTVRSIILFFILFFCVLFASTRWIAFRDAVAEYFPSPSMRAWAQVVSAVDNPFLLLFLLALLYVGYIGFYYIYSTRDPARA